MSEIVLKSAHLEAEIELKSAHLEAEIEVKSAHLEAAAGVLCAELWACAVSSEDGLPASGLLCRYSDDIKANIKESRHVIQATAIITEAVRCSDNIQHQRISHVFRQQSATTLNES